MHGLAAGRKEFREEDLELRLRGEKNVVPGVGNAALALERSKRESGA